MLSLIPRGRREVERMQLKRNLKWAVVSPRFDRCKGRPLPTFYVHLENCRRVRLTTRDCYQFAIALEAVCTTGRAEAVWQEFELG